MNGYIPQAPLHHSLCYLPFTYSTDNDWGLIAFLSTTSNYIQKLKADNLSFDYNTKLFMIESEESDKTYGIIEIAFEEFIFGMMNREIFNILTTKLSLTIYRKGEDVGTSRFTANDFICAVESMIRQLLIDQFLSDAAQ
jgi:hypothetical protein